MAYTTKNANLILLFLIGVSVVVLIGATVYYQINFDDINTRYDTKVKALDETSAKLAERNKILDKTRKELTLKAEREEEFTERYTEVRGERDVLEGEKEDLTKERDNLVADVENLQTDVQQLKADVIYEQLENSKLKADNENLEQDVSLKKQIIDDLQDEVACLESTVDANENTC